MPTGALEPIDTFGNSGLTFDPETGQYHYVWETDESWAGTCRRLIVKLNDGTEFHLLFSFR